MIGLIQIFNISFDTALKKEVINNRFFAPVILKNNMNAAAEERLFTKSQKQGFVFKFNGFKNFRIGDKAAASVSTWLHKRDRCITILAIV